MTKQFPTVYKEEILPILLQRIEEKGNAIMMLKMLWDMNTIEEKVDLVANTPSDWDLFVSLSAEDKQQILEYSIDNWNPRLILFMLRDTPSLLFSLDSLTQQIILNTILAHPEFQEIRAHVDDDWGDFEDDDEEDDEIDEVFVKLIHFKIDRPALFNSLVNKISNIPEKQLFKHIMDGQ